MGQYGYNPGNAATFNQLVRTGVTEEEAAAQSSVSTNASQYGFGPNSNAGSVIPGAGGATNAAGLTTVSYAQSGTGLPAQQPAQTNAPAAGSLTGYGFGTGVVPSVPNTSAAIVELPPFQAPPIDDRIISSTPNASSGFGYGTGINNPSVAPVAAAANTVNANTSGIPIQNEQGDVVAGILQNPETGETYYTTVTEQQRVASAQAATIDANTSGIPIRNEQGDVVQGIRTNPETGETYYTDATGGGQAATPIPTDAPAAVEQTIGVSVASINNIQSPQQAAAAAANAQAVVGTQLAQRQAVLEAQRKMANNGDWRVRLSLAAGANYLYSAPNPGILAPLAKTGGVIFPYMPKIETSYAATYDPVSLTHSNNTNYFYKSSSVGAVNLTGTFTAQDTTEANYLLAVIHFFRSATKMFYGQDAQRGAPPPLVYLTGLGEYQFSAHPCVITSFTYNLPNDVDYIRANSINVNGTSLLTRRVRQDLPTDPISGAVKRLQNLFSSQGINKGAINNPVAPPTLGKNNPTYVPTKLDITLSLLPIQTRAQVSQVFSLKSFANGDLIKGGFW